MLRRGGWRKVVEHQVWCVVPTSLSYMTLVWPLSAPQEADQRPASHRLQAG